MSVEPRTPVIVGVGQVNCAGEAPEPLDLMVAACRHASADANGGTRVLRAVDYIGAVRLLSRRYGDTAALIAERLGARPRRTAGTTIGGQGPQALIDRVAAGVRGGDCDVALVCGGESWRTRGFYMREGRKPPWPTPPTERPPDELIGPSGAYSHPAEEEAGLWLPVQMYPLLETRWRHDLGLSVTEHRDRIARLWSGFSAVAAGNRYAVLPRKHTPAEICAARPVGAPYTKLLTANSSVDQAAAVLIMSAERADGFGIPLDRRIYLHASISASEPYVSERCHLASAPAISAAGQAALGACGLRIDDVAHLDLYSCFPIAVEVAARELGLGAGRPLTVTGGLTFAGGPFNAYVLHAVATMAEVLRADPGAFGLVTSVGGYLTHHAVSLYSARPPREVSLRALGTVATCRRQVVRGYEGAAQVEAYTVMYGRAGAPELAFAACRLADGSRTWATCTDEATLAAWATDEACGTPVRIRGGRLEVTNP